MKKKMDICNKNEEVKEKSIWIQRLLVTVFHLFISPQRVHTLLCINNDQKHFIFHFICFAYRIDFTQTIFCCCCCWNRKVGSIDAFSRFFSINQRPTFKDRTYGDRVQKKGSIYSNVLNNCLHSKQLNDSGNC